MYLQVCTIAISSAFFFCKVVIPQINILWIYSVIMLKYVNMLKICAFSIMNTFS